MTRFSQFAAPAILGAALFVGTQGCASHAPDVSADASMLGEGRTTVSATAPQNGTVYIYDDSANKTVYRGKIDKGDSVRVDAKNNRVLLNDQVALDRDLVNDHRYQIYFDRQRLSEAEPASHRETIIQSPAGGATAITPPPSGSGATVVQPNSGGTTAVQPPANNGGTVVRPDGTVVQPDGTVVKPGNSGTTVVTPTR